MQQPPSIHRYPASPVKDAHFSILIPTWNNLDYLKLCLESIAANSMYQHEVLIHVNEGTDGTLDYVAASGLGYTHSTTNAGVCYSLNALAEISTAPYLVYMNDDMYVGKDWDYHLLEAAAGVPEHRFYFSSTMVEYEETGNAAVVAPYDFGRDAAHFNKTAFDAFVGASSFPDWSGSCWPPSMVHRSWWNKVGGYDVAYSPGFYSDPDFAMKLWELGIRDFRGVGKSLVYHFRCKSTGRVVRNDGRKTFAAKWNIPSSFFYKRMLQMGARFPLKNVNAWKWMLPFARLKAWLIARGV